MLHDPARHVPLGAMAWDEARVRATIARIVADAEARYAPETWWPPHPRDLEPGDDPTLPATTLYWGAAGVAWALHYLQAAGAVRLARSYLDALELLRLQNRARLEAGGSADFASCLMGDTPILMQAWGRQPTPACAAQLAALIEANLDHPARELMWGAPGTLLAALFLHERDAGDAR